MGAMQMLLPKIYKGLIELIVRYLKCEVVLFRWGAFARLTWHEEGRHPMSLAQAA